MHELGVDVGLDLVELGLVVVLGGQEVAVVLVRAVAAATTITITIRFTTMTMTMTIMNRATVMGEPCPTSSSYRPYSLSTDAVGPYGPSAPIGITVTPSGRRYA